MASATQQHDMTLEDWLDDLYVRFIVNRPNEDLSEVARLCFAIEEAHWYYEDFIRPLDPSLPTFALRDFVEKVFEHCPLLSDYSKAHSSMAFEQFIAYKKRIPVRGAILLNHVMDKVVLVKGWKKNSNWSFPRGKVNKDEAPLDCAIRELYEETGLDLHEAGLVPVNRKVKYVDVEMKGQEIRLYVFRDVPETTVFEPQTRCEISEVRWWKISDLPAFRRRPQKGDTVTVGSDAVFKASKFYMVAPFLDKLKKWVVHQKRLDAERARTSARYQQQAQADLTEDDALVTDAYQTDAPTAWEDATPPKAQDIADANAELKRLLNIQEPTVEPSRVISGGSALLALLQGGAAASVAAGVAANDVGNIEAGVAAGVARGIATGVTAGLVSSTAQATATLDHAYTEPLQPRNPQHPDHHLIYHTDQPASTHPPPPSFPFHVTQLSQFHPHFHADRSPRDIKPHVQQMANSSVQQTYTRRSPLRNEAVPLVHPQPKPPQVQTGLLTQGIAPTPEVGTSPLPPPNQNAMYQQHKQQSHARQCISNTVWEQQQHYQPHQSQHVTEPQLSHKNPAPPPLNTHSLSLLNEFKKDSKPPRSKPNTTAQDIATNIKVHAQQQNTTTTLHLKNEEQTPQQNSPQTRTSNQAPADHHKASLLSLFKEPGYWAEGDLKPVVGSRPSEPRHPAGQPYGTIENQGNGVSLLGQEVARANGQDMTQAEDLKAMTRETRTGTQAQIHPDLNLPHRTVGILAGPKQNSISVNSPGGSNVAFPSPKPPQHITTGSPLSNRLAGSDVPGSPRMSSPRSKAIPIQKRPESLSRQAFAGSQGRGVMQPPISSPYGAFSGHMSPQAASSFAGSDSHLQVRSKDTTVEHKKSLLALFGGGDDSVSMSSSVSKGKIPASVSVSGTPRSHHGSSLASGNLGTMGAGIFQQQQGPPSVTSVSMSRQGSHQTNASRRGSQTPISPADRDFLLGYLSTKIDRAGPSIQGSRQ